MIPAPFNQMLGFIVNTVDTVDTDTNRLFPEKKKNSVNVNTVNGSANDNNLRRATGDDGEKI